MTLLNTESKVDLDMNQRRRMPFLLPAESPVWRATLWLAAVFFAGCGPGGDADLRQLRESLPEQAGINVIVLSFDALRADALGAYGSDRDLTPRLDAFSRSGLVFENAYTVAPVTPTSFASAFTGLLPTRVFHRWNLTHEDTLAKRFSDGGYLTSAFLNNVQLTSERHFDQGFDEYHLYRSRPDEEALDGALRWLGEHRHERFFTWIHLLNPHAPYDYRDLAAHTYDAGYQGRFETTSGPRFETDDPGELARLKSLYDGEVFYVDTLFGRFHDELQSLGLLEHSIVVVTSDHGEEFREHGGFQHDRLTEEHVRIPLIFHHPSAPAPRRSQVLASNVDLFPTLLSVAGLGDDFRVDGRDLTRLTQKPDWIAGVSMTGKTRWLSLRQGTHKLIRTCPPESRLTLYDLVLDPGETADLSEERPAVARELHRNLGVVLGGPPCSVMQAAVRGEDPTVGLSDENVEALKALGYLSE